MSGDPTRMSEDIDFRIVSEDLPGRGALRRLREAVTQALLGAGSSSIPPTRRIGNPDTTWRIARQAGIELTAGYAKRGYRTAAE